jgi:hypothetical protein
LKSNYFYIFCLFIFSILSQESVLFFFSGALLLLIFRLFWRVNEPKHLLINLLLYWAVVAILIPYSDIINQPLNKLTKYGKSDIRAATWISLIALTIYLIGVKLAIRKVKIISTIALSTILNKYNGTKIIIVYLSVSIISAILNSSIVQVPGGQLLLAVVYMKWVILTMLIAFTLVNSANRKLVILIISFEVILSFSGFWAEFKNYFLVAIGAYLFLLPKFSFRSTFLLIFISIITISFSVIWSYSKGEYRQYLTGGERSQVIIQQNLFSNVEKFIEIVLKDFSAKNFVSSFSDGIDNLIYRVSYVEFLSMTLKQVPAYLPHENGILLQNAFEHILKPRLFFPDKKPIYDSELTSKYTGVQFSGAEQGTSFSLGTVAESYVDFGRYYMFIPIFFFGLWIGWMYRYFIINGYNVVWGMCYSAPIFQFAWSFPVPTSKFLGWSITYFLGFWFLNKFLIQYLDSWLQKGKTDKS